MLTLLINLIIILVLLGLVFWVTKTLGGAFGIPSQIMAVIQVVLVVIFVLMLLSMLVSGPLIDSPRWLVR